MKIIFMGTPEFAVPTLKELIKSDHEIVSIFTQKPKPKNRGLKEEKSPIHKIGEENNIKIFTPENLKKNEFYNLVLEQECDIIVVAAYGFIIPKIIIDYKPCINLHPSLLPRWRGASPLQRTIINGDKNSAVCTIKMDEGMDTGDILLKEEFNINDNITLSEYHDFCANLGATLVLKTINNYYKITPQKQSNENVTYAKKLTKEEGRIFFSESAIEIDRKIRGMNPWPGTYFIHGNMLIKILEIETLYFPNITSEKQFLDDKELIISCKSSDAKNAVKINKLQIPGKKPVSGKDFLLGYSKNFKKNSFLMC